MRSLILALIFSHCLASPLGKAAEPSLEEIAKQAAQAGAKSLEQTLSTMASLNWEMRRAYKQFAFDTSIIAQFRAMPCYPLDATGKILAPCVAQYGSRDPLKRFTFAIEDPRSSPLTVEKGGPFLPAVCWIFNADNNFCTKFGAASPTVKIEQAFTEADPIIEDQYPLMQRNGQRDSTLKTRTNRGMVRAWLFNPELKGGGLSDEFLPAEGLDRLGVLVRMALLHIRLEKLRAASEQSLHQAVEESAKAAGAQISEIKILPNPLQTEMLSEPIAVANFAWADSFPSSKEDPRESAHREYRIIESFPLGFQISNPPSSVHVALKVKGAEASAEAPVKAVKIGPDPLGEKGRIFTAMAWDSKAHFANPLIASADRDSQSEGFTTNSHLGFLRRAAIELESLSAARKLAGAFTAWEASRYTPPCAGKIGVVILARLGAITPDALRLEMAKFFGKNQSILTLKKILPDEKIKALLRELKASGQLELINSTDPLLSGDPKLSSYARKNSKDYDPEKFSSLPNCEK